MKSLDEYRVEMRNDKGQLAELFAVNGEAVYQASFHRNETIVWKLPPAKRRDAPKEKSDLVLGSRSSLTGFYLGPPVNEAKELFYIRLAQEDDDWIYLTLLPRTSSMQASYQRMRVVLDRKTFHLLEIWFDQPNGSEETIEFEKPVKEKQPITEEALLRDFPEKRQQIPQPERIPID